MKVNLLIADDEELRASVKELIQAEVKSIVRGSVREILGEVIVEKVVTNRQLDDVIREEVVKLVRAALVRPGGDWEGTVKSIAREEIQRWLNERIGINIKIA